MSDVGGFEGKILCEVPPCAPCDSGDTGDTPATGYTPPEGWRVLAVGEVLREGDVWVNQEGESRPTKRVGETVNDERYIRAIEPELQPVPQPPVPQRESDAELQIRLLREANDSQVETIGRLQAAINERAELGGADQTRAELQARIRELETIRDTQAATIDELRSEVSHVQWLLGESRQRVTHLEELVTSLRNSNTAQKKALDAADKANTDLQHRLNVVSAEWAEQAETIKRLQARIFDLETINQAMEKAVNDAGKANNKLRTQAEEFRFEISYLQNLLGEERAKQADKLAQIEVLQPIAAACHAAQTMVRDMLGHMRCLLALQHTTDRRDSCTLLESILEVFDEAECDEDEDDTSEAGQG